MEPFTLDLPMGLGMALAENLPALDALCRSDPRAAGPGHRRDPHHPLPGGDAGICPAPDRKAEPLSRSPPS